MGKFDHILICTDLDGTLLRNDKTISDQNLAAIDYFKSEGGIFTFVTGRMPFFVSDVYHAVHPNAPFGCINGGGLYDHSKQKYLWKHEISRHVLELVEYIDSVFPDMGIQVNTFTNVLFCKENLAMELFRRITKLPNIVRDYRDVSEPIAKIVFGSHIEEDILRLEKLLKAHPLSFDFDFIRSEKSLFEILPKGIGKGMSISKLCELFDFDIEKTISVGDYYNDISMFHAAKVGIAVSNGCREAREAADYCTVSNEEHAIARIIDDLEKGRISL